MYAVVERENDIEDKLVVTTKDLEYTKHEIEKEVEFQEKYFKRKIKK